MVGEIWCASQLVLKYGKLAIYPFIGNGKNLIDRISGVRAREWPQNNNINIILSLVRACTQ